MKTLITGIMLLLAINVYGEDMKKDIAAQEAVGKKMLAITSSEGKQLVSVRQVNPSSYEVVTSSSKGTEKKIVSVRRTVGNTYEVIEN